MNENSVFLKTLNLSGDDQVTFYNQVDGFSFVKYFYSKYQYFPNQCSLNIDYKESDKVCFSQENILSDISKKYDVTYTFVDTYNVSKKETSHGYRIVFNDEPVMFFLDSSINNCVIFYGINCQDTLKDLMDIIDSNITKEEENNVGNLFLVISGMNGFELVDIPLKKVEMNIEENYNDDFLSKHERIVKFMEDEESGIVLLHGEKGTGKTSYIRYLANSFNKKFIFLSPEVAAQMSNPAFMKFLFKLKGGVLILEDCENLVAKRGTVMSNTNAVANILNISDGFLSDAFSLKIICTFNAPIGNIDEALTRKGRMKAQHEFKPLCATKAKVLLEKNGFKPEKEEDLTLAQIYYYNDPDYCEERRRVGLV